MTHEIRRIRHEIRQRPLTVAAVETVTPNMLRIHLGGPALDGFVSLAPDDHVKLFFPVGPDRVERRDYTPRRYDPATKTLAIDFALHEDGPATCWARAARPGQTIVVAGPKGSAIIPDRYEWWLLIGDESALPAIGRRIEEMPAGRTVVSLVAVAGPEEEQRLVTAADLQAHWVHRPLAAAGDPASLLAALRDLPLPPGEGFVWIAAEAGVARAARDCMLSERHHPAGAIKAGGYWVKGRADAHEKFED